MERERRDGRWPPAKTGNHETGRVTKGQAMRGGVQKIISLGVLAKIMVTCAVQGQEGKGELRGKWPLKALKF